MGGCLVFSSRWDGALVVEVERVARHLARRLTASRQYGDKDLVVVEDGGIFYITLPLSDADVLLYMEGSEGRVRAVLSFLMFREGGGNALHLNNWFRRPMDDGASVSDLVERIWAKFYEDEQENYKLNRVLWMHGPLLPQDMESLPPPRDKTPRNPPPKVASVFDLFGE